MSELVIKELKEIKQITLNKLNKEIIAEIPLCYLIEQTKSIDEVDTIKLTIPFKYRNNYTKQTQKYYVYDEVLAERLICVDGEYYVIKEISENELKHTKEITCYGLEKKLEKNTFVMSDCGIMLKDSDEENYIYSFDECLYDKTGWRLGHIDTTVRYMDNGEPKMRMQEETNTSFYSFITETIAEQFCCVPTFDRKNKLVNLYDIDSFGNDLKLVLNKDNYLKSLERTYNSSDIVTRLILEGNEEKCIVEEATATGLNYIENYSYFIDNGEMSKELTRALKLFESITPKRMEKWKYYTTLKAQKQAELTNLDSSENILMTKCKQLQDIINGYSDMDTEEEYYMLDDLKSEYDISHLELQSISEKISTLEREIGDLEKKIKVLNKLCRRETSEDDAGNLLFTKELLNELKDFIYYDTYSDDSFLDANELIKTGEHILESKCKPTVEFTIDSVNFTKRLLSNKFILTPKIELGLGDVISTYDSERDKEDFAFLVGWSMNYQDNTLNLTLSNKKTNKDNTRVIADLLKKSRETKKIISVNKWLWNKEKYSKVNSTLVTNINLDIDSYVEKLATDKVSAVDLSEHNINIDLNQTHILKATVLPETASNKNVIWISSDENIASVKDGVVIGNSYGACIITVISEDGNKTDTCKVIVEVDMSNDDSVNVTGIRLNNISLDLDIHESNYLIHTILPINANQSATYISSNGNVAKVSNEGLITAVGQGKCTITVVSNKNTNIKATCNVNVSNKEAEINIDSLENVLILGTRRIRNLQDNNMQSNMTYVIDRYTPFDISKYPNNPKVVLIMMGLIDNSLYDVIEIKSLLSSIKNKYNGKYIFLADELPVGVNYATESISYKQLNNQIENYNKTLIKYASELGIKSITLQSGMCTSNILNSSYAYNGVDLNTVGCKMLLNNIKYQIKNNVNSYTPPNSDDSDSSDSSNNPYREKIIKKAEEIVNMCVNHKANYSQRYRTISYKSPNTIKSRSEYVGSTLYNQPSWVVLNETIGYDCSSFTGVCYEYAGIEYLKGLSCSAGSLQATCKSHGAKFWRYTGQESVNKLKPGDIIMVANNGAVVTDNNMATVSTHHVMISGGGNTVLHASGFNSGILKQNINFTNKHFFIRIPEVAELDKNNSSNITNSSDSEHKNVFYENGTIDGMNYVAKLTNCRMTAYYSQNTTGGSGLPLSVAKSVGSFNLPYGTKIFIPYLKGRWGNTDGIVTVSDTGVGCTTFDLYLGKTLSDVTSKMKSPLNVDAYIIEYGTGKIAWSYTESFNWAYNYYNGNISRFKTAFNNYMQYGGTLINFWKFKDDDKTFFENSWIKQIWDK